METPLSSLLGPVSYTHLGLDGEPAAKMFAKAQSMGKFTVMDTAWDPTGRWMKGVEAALPYLDLFMPSIEAVSYTHLLALFGAADALKKTGKKIITTSIEHPSVLNAAKELEKRGFEVVFLPVYGDGKIKLDDLKKELDESVILVSIMLVNNETGAVQPVKEAASLTKRLCKNALFHCDMVQGLSLIHI